MRVPHLGKVQTVLAPHPGRGQPFRRLHAVSA
jgi:hypothetical protein